MLVSRNHKMTFEVVAFSLNAEVVAPHRDVGAWKVGIIYIKEHKEPYLA